MIDPGGARSIPDLVRDAAAESGLAADSMRHFGEDSPRVLAYVEHGVPWSWAVAPSQSALDDLRGYAVYVGQPHGAAWMDNTTLVTAEVLLSEAGPAAMTPLTVWDLVTFCRAVVCYERIYHHSHPDVDDDRINRLLGSDVLHPVPLPTRPTAEGSPLPDPWDGAHRFLCDLWEHAHNRIGYLRKQAGTLTLDGAELAAVRAAWAYALQRDDLAVDDLVNASDVSTRWVSPSNQMLAAIADITDIDDTSMYVDPAERFRRPIKFTRVPGEPNWPRQRLGELLTDLNLRTYINQRLADFFELPYAAAVARMPFRKHLYDRAVSVQHQLYSVDVLENRYAELAEGVRLCLPVFLAVALIGARVPSDLWGNLAEQRERARKFRGRRVELDAALGRQDRKEVLRVSEALHTDVSSLHGVLGRAVAESVLTMVEDVAKGDVHAVATGVAAAKAAGERLISSSLSNRLLWRLCRPHLLYLNNIIDEAHQLTEALPDFSRIWKIPEREQPRFAARFSAMAGLQL